MKMFSNLTKYNDWGLLVLRIGIGAIFMAHGLMKFGVWNMEPTEQFPASMVMILSGLAILEPLGAVAMIVGFWTSLTSIGMGILMALVINMKITSMQTGFMGETGTGWEFDFILLCACVCILLTGPGKISLEKYLSKNSQGSWS